MTEPTDGDAGMRGRIDPTTIAGGAGASFAPRARDATLAKGDVLNGIYRVERFIARGGMGEVFEGVNVETDERVAIKAIRSHLASDPKIVALFRKEARVLTHISHPAIVQYRVFARDPLLDLHYIVTDFIDGEPITAHLNGERPAIGEVVTLARRLASGLEAAHDRGAIHRDMSPDNILLPDGRMERAKIVDFGIAKSLDLSGETVVGEGFAGKLGYVAPEQFGDFGRQIGPWTDVYSTALVLLAFARGKAPPMGTTLSEAVERRRIAVDLSDLPVPIAPLIERMLAPDPADRVRSMREVLVALDTIRLMEDRLHVSGGGDQIAPDAGHPGAPLPDAAEQAESPPQDSAPDPIPIVAQLPAGTIYAPAVIPDIALPKDDPAKPVGRSREPAATPSAATKIQKVAERPASGGSRRARRVAMPLVLMVLALVAGLFAYRHSTNQTVARPDNAGPVQPAVQLAMSSLLPSLQRADQWNVAVRDLPCAWLTAHPTTPDGPTTLSGGSGDVAGLAGRLKGKPASWGSVTPHDVEPLSVTQCGVIDALRPYRASASEQQGGAISLLTSGIVPGQPGPSCPEGGILEVTAAQGETEREWALIGLRQDGRLLQIAGSRAELDRLAREQHLPIKAGGDGLYHAAVCYALTGSAAIFLLESGHAADLGLRTGQPALPADDFASRLASEQGARVFAQWAKAQSVAPVERAAPAPAPAPAPASAGLTDTPPSGKTARIDRQPPARSTQQGISRAQDAIATAELNLREAKRIKDMDTGFCRSYDGRWRDLGMLGRDACMASAIKDHCTASFAMFKDKLYRRYNTEIQEQRGNRWTDVFADGGCGTVH